MMIEKSTLDFLKNVKKHNDREWFELNRLKYESAKENFEELVAALVKELSKINPALGTLKVKDCVFRIYRDVRFSKLKIPYKTNMGAYFAEGGKKSDKAGFYLQLEPGKSFAAAGCWMPQPAELKKIRQEIDYNLLEFEKIMNMPALKKMYGSLGDSRVKTSPKGYDGTNPAIEHLRQTSFVVSATIKDKSFSEVSFIKEVGKMYKNVYPLIQFLNTAIS